MTPVYGHPARADAALDVVVPVLQLVHQLAALRRALLHLLVPVRELVQLQLHLLLRGLLPGWWPSGGKSEPERTKTEPQPQTGENSIPILGDGGVPSIWCGLAVTTPEHCAHRVLAPSPGSNPSTSTTIRYAWSLAEGCAVGCFRMARSIARREGTPPEQPDRQCTEKLTEAADLEKAAESLLDASFEFEKDRSALPETFAS